MRSSPTHDLAAKETGSVFGGIGILLTVCFGGIKFIMLWLRSIAVVGSGSSS